MRGSVKEYGQELAIYCASLRILAVRKGAANPGDIVQVTWRHAPHGLVGPWTLAYSPGEEVVTHLKWDAVAGR